MPKPRLAAPADRSGGWDVKYFPSSFAGFLGEQNKATILTMSTWAEKHVARNVIVFGDRGSGKTALLNVYANALLGAEPAAAAAAKPGAAAAKREKKAVPLLRLSHEDAKNLNSLQSRIANFLDKFKHTNSPKHRLIIFDGLCRTSPNTQQWLDRIMDDFPQIRWLSACYEPERIIAKVGALSSVLRVSFDCLGVSSPRRPLLQVRARCEHLKMRPTAERLSLKILLRILMAERVGYERSAIAIVWSAHGPQLGEAIGAFQDVFVKHHFVSYISGNAAEPERLCRRGACSRVFFRPSPQQPAKSTRPSCCTRRRRSRARTR